MRKPTRGLAAALTLAVLAELRDLGHARTRSRVGAHALEPHRAAFGEGHPDRIALLGAGVRGAALAAAVRAAEVCNSDAFQVSETGSKQIEKSITIYG